MNSQICVLGCTIGHRDQHKQWENDRPVLIAHSLAAGLFKGKTQCAHVNRERPRSCPKQTYL
jgi:hypothetical protein